MEEIAAVKPPLTNDVVGHWEELFPGLMAVTSEPGLRYSNGFGELHRSILANPDITSYYDGDGLAFIDGEIDARTARGGEAYFAIDYSVGLDANVVNELRTFLLGSPTTGPRERAINLLRHLRARRINHDRIIYMLEEFSHSGAATLRNTRTRDNIAAMKLLDHMTWDGSSEAIPTFSISLAQAQSEARELIDDPQLQRVIEGERPRQRLMYALLLKLYLARAEGREREDVFQQVLRYCANDLGVIAKMELFWAYQIIFSSAGQAFGGPLTATAGSTADRLRKIKGMSWDLCGMRLSETSMTNNQDGQFFVPYYASFDGKFSNLKAAFPVRHVLMDRQTKELFSMFVNEIEFARCVERNGRWIPRARTGIPSSASMDVIIASLESAYAVAST